LNKHGFDGCVFRHIAEPSHLRFSRMSYAFGVFLHRWLPSAMWPSILVFAQRREDA
jgi:hypothetical protein